MSRSPSHIRRPNAATQATIDLLRAPVARTPRRNWWPLGRRLWAAFVALSVILGLWIGLASVGWAPPIPPGPWSHRVVHVVRVHQKTWCARPVEPAQRPAFRRDSPSIGQRTYVRPKGHERCPLGYSLLPAKPGRSSRRSRAGAPGEAGQERPRRWSMLRRLAVGCSVDGSGTAQSFVSAWIGREISG
jgi:hypothetical protein